MVENQATTAAFQQSAAHRQSGLERPVPPVRRWSSKRILDLLIAWPAVVALSPLMSLIALLVRLHLGSPILFRQTRAGLGGATFNVFKFRTMTDCRDASGFLLDDQARATGFGRLLRGTSLDELPQLWNVIRGEMSLVGPRPLLPEYTARYTRHQQRRLEVLPGITGWAQINGRNTLSWERKFELDVWYVEHRDFWLDAQILARTIINVFRRAGIRAADHETMPEFRGTR